MPFVDCNIIKDQPPSRHVPLDLDSWHVGLEGWQGGGWTPDQSGVEGWKSRWWFQTCFIFIPIWGRFPFWLMFLRWVETTNQMIIFSFKSQVNEQQGGGWTPTRLGWKVENGKWSEILERMTLTDYSDILGANVLWNVRVNFSMLKTSPWHTGPDIPWRLSPNKEPSQQGNSINSSSECQGGKFWSLHPWKSTWNPKMQIWKMMFIFKKVILRFHQWSFPVPSTGGRYYMIP